MALPKSGKIDAGEYQVRKHKPSQFQILKDMLEKLVGKEIEISSNLERAKSETHRTMTLYRIGQRYNELGQVLTLENPSLPDKEIPQILISPNMEISKEGKKIILRYPRQVSFRSLKKPTLPDLEIYIQPKEE